MVGLYQEIEKSLDIMIDGLNYDFLEGQAILDIDPERMRSLAKSKITSLSGAKKIINRWVESPNRPSDKKLEEIIQRIVDAGDSSINVLRKALEVKIDYNKLEVHKHEAAISSKPVLLESILEIDGELKELREKLRTGDLTLVEREFDLGYPEKFAKGEFFPLKDYYKEPLTEEGGVVIDPKGSKGRRFTIYDLEIIIPRVPRDKTEILFHDLPKEKQYWVRQPEPNITTGNIDEYHEYILEEYRRRREGIWFYNNGEPTYLTGNHYWALQWCKMLDDGDYPKYREVQRDLFYFMEASLVDKRCLGTLLLKSRRTGFTYAALDIILNMSTSKGNGKFGMMSKSGTDGQEMFDKISYMFLSLPFWLRPVVRGKLDSPKELFFGQPSDNSKETKKSKKTNISDYLNTSLDWRNTLNGSYDSIKLDGYVFDECISPSESVLCSDLSFKKASDLKEGDYLMGINGKPIKIAKLSYGYDDMYRVVQPRSRDYVVNKDHRLLFTQLYGKNHLKERDIIVTPEEYLNFSKTAKILTFRKSLQALDFKEQELEIDPYILGVWLGDGSSYSSSICVNKHEDIEIYNAVLEYAEKNGFGISENNGQEFCAKLYISDKSRRNNRFRDRLRGLNVWANKHIPKKYFKSSLEQRLNLLAGLIDTDGTRNKGTNVFHFTMADKTLIYDIYHLAKQCGLGAGEVKKHNTERRGTKLVAYSLSISDKKGIIPTRVQRKKTTKTIKERGRRDGFDIVPIGKGPYVGITLDTQEEELRTLILKDYTLTKNCGKIVAPNDAIVHLGMITPTMMPNGRVVGKMFAGSTMGGHEKGGGNNFISLIEGSHVKDRDPKTQKTATGLYFYFIPAQDNMEEFTDIYGKCWKDTPPKGTKNVLGDFIKMGSNEYLDALEEQKKKQGEKAYNEQKRTYPRCVQDAMRDESGGCMFNAEKINEQMDYNKKLPEESLYMVGNFNWKDGIKDSDVVFNQDINGRFKVAWLPSKIDGTEYLQNRVKTVNGKHYPLNGDVLKFGCDPFSLASTHGEGSKGGLHGLTLKFPEGGAPSNKFVVEYIARPSDEFIFFEDVIKCIRFYGAPILVESNRIDLLRHMYNRGYRGFGINRLDRHESQLNEQERKYSGQMMSGKDIIDSHLNSVGAWIENYVGVYKDEERKIRPVGEMGDMPFNETLDQWLKYNDKDRTKFDGFISSGLAIMACNASKYKGPLVKKKKVDVRTMFPVYENKGSVSTPFSKN